MEIKAVPNTFIFKATAHFDDIKKGPSWDPDVSYTYSAVFCVKMKMKSQFWKETQRAYENSESPS